MTVPSEASRSIYAGNGVTTEFSTGWYFTRAGDVRVIITPVGLAPIIQTLGVHYTLTVPAPGSGAAGVVTMVTPPASGAEVVVERTVAFVQDTSFRSKGTFAPAVHEDAMDRLEFQLQELDRRTSDLEGGIDPGVFDAGNGLSVAGITLNVGAGDGILSLPDSVAVDFATAASSVGAGAGSAGVSTKVSRGDHQHQVSTGAPTPLAVGYAGATGTSASLSRADHVHPVPQAGAGDLAAVDAGAPSAGATGAFADGGHKHTVTTAAAVDLTDATSGAGVATSLARSDHTHAHGARGGDTLHALATTTVAGFMSAADKTKLNGLSEDVVTDKAGQTTNATPTVLMSWTPDNQTAEEVELTVVGRKQGSVDAAGYRRRLVVSRFDGVTSLVGTVDTIGADKETAAAWDIAVSIASPAVQVLVTGAAATTIDWHGRARRVVAP